MKDDRGEVTAPKIVMLAKFQAYVLYSPYILELYTNDMFECT